MRASGDERRPVLRNKRLTAAAVGLFVIATAITVALPAGAGSNRRALRDVHGTKAFWQRTTLKRVAKSPGMPTLKLRGKSVKPFRLDVRSLHRVLANTPWERTRAARLHPVVVSLPTPNGRFQRFALERTAIMAPALQRKHPRDRHLRRARDRRLRRDDRRRPEPVRLPRVRSLSERRVVHRPLLPQEPQLLRQLPRAAAEGVAPVQRARRARPGSPVRGRAARAHG